MKGFKYFEILASKIERLFVIGIYLEGLGPVQSDLPGELSQKQTEGYDFKMFPQLYLRGA